MHYRQLFLTIITAFLSSWACAQAPTTGGTLLDQNDQPVTKEEFMKLIDRPDIMLVKNDSLPIYKAVSQRSETGTIDNYEEIVTTLTQANIAVDRTKPIIVIFHPGKDPCNSSGSATKADIIMWKNKLTRNTQKIAQTTPLYLYRTPTGLKDDAVKWQKDPQQIIEKTFFKFHYPCGSYVIIAPSAKYVSYFGEFSHEVLYSDLKFAMQQ